MMYEKKYIGNTCYISLSSKAELVSTDNSTRIPLSVTEYKVLSFFIDHANVLIQLDELAQFVWGTHADEKDPNSLKSQISRVRNKLEQIREGMRHCIDTNYGLNSYTLKVENINSPEIPNVFTPEDSPELSSAASIEEAYALFEQSRYDEAIAIFRQAAIKGDSEAQYWLGYCYRFGKGTAQDHWQAVKWFRKSAEQGNANAQYYLGICYYMGQAVPQDYRKAFEYASLAASQGHADAQASVANYYCDGKGVEKNRELAIELFEKAVRMGSTYARVRLDIVTGQIDTLDDNDEWE